MRLRIENALAADDRARQRRALEAVLTQVTRLETLLRNLLSSVQRAQPTLALVDLAALLTAKATQFREQAAAAGLAVAAADGTVLLDAERIGRGEPADG